jgi:hypothetical protein
VPTSLDNPNVQRQNFKIETLKGTSMKTDIREVKMRTDCDCMVACLAMLMQWTYEEAASYFPPKAVLEKGYHWDYLIPFLRANRIYFILYDGELLSSVDWTKPAMLDVPSLTAPDKGDHIIYWNGTTVIDPSNKEQRYFTKPDAINAVYQLKSSQALDISKIVK